MLLIFEWREKSTKQYWIHYYITGAIILHGLKAQATCVLLVTMMAHGGKWSPTFVHIQPHNLHTSSLRMYLIRHWISSGVHSWLFFIQIFLSIYQMNVVAVVVVVAADVVRWSIECRQCSQPTNGELARFFSLIPNALWFSAVSHSIYTHTYSAFMLIFEEDETGLCRLLAAIVAQPKSYLTWRAVAFKKLHCWIDGTRLHFRWILMCFHYFHDAHSHVPGKSDWIFSIWVMMAAMVCEYSTLTSIFFMIWCLTISFMSHCDRVQEEIGSPFFSMAARK